MLTVWYWPIIMRDHGQVKMQCMDTSQNLADMSQGFFNIQRLQVYTWWKVGRNLKKNKVALTLARMVNSLEDCSCHWLCNIWQDRTRQERRGQDRTEQGKRAGQGRKKAGQDSTSQERTCRVYLVESVEDCLCERFHEQVRIVIVKLPIWQETGEDRTEQGKGRTGQDFPRQDSTVFTW